MKSMTFKCTTTEMCLKMLVRLLQAVCTRSFPCLAVVSWGWATKKQFTPLPLDDGTVWATPMGPIKDVIFQPVRDAVDATRNFLTAMQLIKVSETKPRLRCYPGQC